MKQKKPTKTKQLKAVMKISLQSSLSGMSRTSVGLRVLQNGVPVYPAAQTQELVAELQPVAYGVIQRARLVSHQVVCVKAKIKHSMVNIHNLRNSPLKMVACLN